MAVKCGKAHGYHADVNAVRACYNGETVELFTDYTLTSGASATEKQVNYLASLLTKHGLGTAKIITAYGKREISPVINFLKATTPGHATPQELKEFGLIAAPDGASLGEGKPRDYTDPKALIAKRIERFNSDSLEAGIYLFQDQIFKVQRAIYGSNHMYAKLLVKGENGAKSGFQRAPGAIRNLRPEHKMTLDQAKQFGKIYGCCVRCGRILTKESSIDQFMGDWCASQF